MGSEFKINENVASCGMYGPSVAMDGQGNFVVTWINANGAAYDEIEARRFSANGQPLSGEFQVNSYFLGRQINPKAAMTSTGEFIIVWKSDKWPYEDRVEFYIAAQRYQANGAPVGSEFNVSQTCHGDHPDIAIRDNGDFVVSWIRDGDSNNPPYGRYIMRRRFYANGTPKEDETYLTENIYALVRPCLGMDPEGRFIIAWSYSPDGYQQADIHVQRFAEDGMAVGAEFIANTNLPGMQYWPEIAMNANGGFLITWYGPDSDGDGVFGRRYDASGNPVTDEFPMNHYVTLDQRFPAAAMQTASRYFAVWQSKGQDGNKSGVYGAFVPEGFAGDFNGDNAVNEIDLGFLTDDWLGNEPVLDIEPAENGDGIINLQDFLRLAENWLSGE